jgi:hypothetical protein
MRMVSGRLVAPPTGGARGPSSSQRLAPAAPSGGPCGGDVPHSRSGGAGGWAAEAAVARVSGGMSRRAAWQQWRGRAGSVAAAAVSGAGVWGLLKVLGAQARSLLDRIHLIYDGRNWAVID